MSVFVVYSFHLKHFLVTPQVLNEEQSDNSAFGFCGVT
jgi:hypothetical protein